MNKQDPSPNLLYPLTFMFLQVHDCTNKTKKALSVFLDLDHEIKVILILVLPTGCLFYYEIIHFVMILKTLGTPLSFTNKCILNI